MRKTLLTVACALFAFGAMAQESEGITFKDGAERSIYGPKGNYLRVRGGDNSSSVCLYGGSGAKDGAFISLYGNNFGTEKDNINGRCSIIGNTTGKSSHAGLISFLHYDGENWKLRYRIWKNGMHNWYTRGGVLRMSLLENGNVGIGTADPGSYKLAVEGKIGAREVVVTTDAWADFVFDSNYDLMSLSELDAFIKENKHLPEIPTTKEVAEQGVAVGEMNAKLLQKIEELTLYIIKQDKRIEAQNKRIEQLENK